MIKSTYSQKAKEVKRSWFIVDAGDNNLGRVATVIATRLIGKHKPTFTPSMDDGDHVIVINAEKLKVTGNKELSKSYYRHSGYPGALKEATLGSKLAANKHDFVIAEAVKGMLPKNKLQSERMKRLHIYSGTEHNHEGQKPENLEVK